MFVMDVLGDKDRMLGQFVINEPRFTVGRLINPDNRDSDATRFLALFGEDARQIAQCKEITFCINQLQSDYPDVELHVEQDLENDPELDVDELVLFVKRITGLDLDTLPDKQFTVVIEDRPPSFSPSKGVVSSRAGSTGG
jgi:hypothetical protein